MRLCGLYGVTASGETKLARVMMIPATGDCSHTAARTTFHIELLEQCICLFRGHTSHFRARQSRIEGFLLGRFGTPYRQTENAASKQKDEPDEHGQRQSCPPIELLELRATRPHPSLYSMRGTPKRPDDFLAAGIEIAVSGQVMAMNGAGRGV